MRLANQAMADDFPLKNLATLFEFAAKKAGSLGESTEQLASSLINAFGTGNTRALKQFGIDINFVSDQFDKINGQGAFDSLEFAQRRSLILAAATTKMREEMKRLGVSGKEVGFAWQGIKTEIGDAADKLTLAVVRSKALTSGLTGFKDFLGGIAYHFEKGGSIGELLFGKGHSGGLWGVAKGFGRDIGTAIGEGLKSVLLDFWDEIKWDILRRGIGHLARSSLAKVGSVVEPLIADISPEGRKKFDAAAEAFAGGDRKKGLTLNALAKIQTAYDAERSPLQTWLKFTKWALDTTGIAGLTGWNKGPTTQPAAIGGGFGGAMSLPVFMAQAVAASVMGTWGVGDSSGLGAWHAFQREFARPSLADSLAAAKIAPDRVPKGLMLSDYGDTKAFGEFKLLARQIERDETLAGRDARRLAAEQAAELRRQGWAVGPGRQAEMERDITAKLIKERTGVARARFNELGGLLGILPNEKDKAGGKAPGQSLNELVQIGKDVKDALDKFAGGLGAVAAKLTGVQGELRAAGGRGRR